MTRKCQQCMLESRPAEYVLTGIGGARRFVYALGSIDATWCKVCSEREREKQDGPTNTKKSRHKLGGDL